MRLVLSDQGTETPSTAPVSATSLGRPQRGIPIARRHSRKSVFLNVPYDRRFEKAYLAFIAGLCGFGLVPRATLQLPGPQRRLDRIVELIQECRYSVHDLSRVQASGPSPRTPRFNMPFELGLAIMWSLVHPKKHEWVVFEEQPHRLQRSLSDLNGTDPYVHHGDPDRVLTALSDAFIRTDDPPSVEELRLIHAAVRRAADAARTRYHDIFSARPFEELVLAATNAAEFVR